MGFMFGLELLEVLVLGESRIGGKQCCQIAAGADDAHDPNRIGSIVVDDDIRDPAELALQHRVQGFHALLPAPAGFNCDNRQPRTFGFTARASAAG